MKKPPLTKPPHNVLIVFEAHKLSFNEASLLFRVTDEASCKEAEIEMTKRFNGAGGEYNIFVHAWKQS